jgi:hypothetical protein
MKKRQIMNFSGIIIGVNCEDHAKQIKKLWAKYRTCKYYSGFYI